jgi:hypothetical protein
MAEGTAGDAAAGTLPSVEEALAWAGARVEEIGGASVGRIEGVYVDVEDGSPRWLLVRVRRFGHYSLLPFPHAAAGVGHVWVPYERAAIRGAPRIEAGRPLTRELELEFCAHFGIPEDAGRAAELRGRDAGVASARLAASA